jgi:four helix bundle protein
LLQLGAAVEISPQLIDSAGSYDSNYRGACRARTKKEFIAKSAWPPRRRTNQKGWLEILHRAQIGDTDEAAALIQEANELTAILVASKKTARRNLEIEEKRKRSRRRRNR